MNKQVEETLKLFANQETTVQYEYVWVPFQEYYSPITFERMPEPKRIEIDIIKQWIIDNNYDRSYLLNLIETAIKEIERNEA